MSYGGDIITESRQLNNANETSQIRSHWSNDTKAKVELGAAYSILYEATFSFSRCPN